MLEKQMEAALEGEEVKVFDDDSIVPTEDIATFSESLINEIKYARAKQAGEDTSGKLPSEFAEDTLEIGEGSNLYYIYVETKDGKEKAYVYDEKTGKVFKIESTIVWGVPIHGYDFGAALKSEDGLLDKAKGEAKEEESETTPTPTPTEIIILGIKAGEPVENNTKLTDENGDTITIPKGFSISKESPSTVTSGMIIEDNQDNQYVWIPVFTVEKYDWGVDYSNVTSGTDYLAIETALQQYTENHNVSSTYEDKWYGDGDPIDYGYYLDSDVNHENLIYYSNGNMTEQAYNNLYRNLLLSIYTNGGFYIGRYEMGIGVATSVDEASALKRKSMKEYITSTTSDNNTAPSISGMPYPVSKQNAVVYDVCTRDQLQMLAQSLSNFEEYDGVEPSLMFWIQMKATAVFIEKFDKNNSAETKLDWLYDSNYSVKWGNYSDSNFKLDRGFYYSANVWYDGKDAIKESGDKWYCTTGASDQNCSLNIFDFGGNAGEETLTMNDQGSYQGVVGSNRSLYSETCSGAVYSSAGYVWQTLRWLYW